jgi:hypothetical protein
VRLPRPESRHRQDLRTAGRRRRRISVVNERDPGLAGRTGRAATSRSRRVTSVHGSRRSVRQCPPAQKSSRRTGRTIGSRAAGGPNVLRQRSTTGPGTSWTRP